MSELELSKSFRLFSVPSFWSGVASMLDFNGVLNTLNYSESESIADIESLQDDWSQIASDLNQAIRIVKSGKTK